MRIKYDKIKKIKSEQEQERRRENFITKQCSVQTEITITESL